MTSFGMGRQFHIAKSRLKVPQDFQILFLGGQDLMQQQELY